MVDGITYIPFTACHTAQTFQTFTNPTCVTAIKTMVYFISFLSDKAIKLISSIYAPIKSTCRITAPSAFGPSFNRIQPRSYYVIHY